mmetsp:Transcript_13509/g.50603  ORF Transcript_13509/g.50603 Transcript_13509/m.50603 type:complete len:309 (+) Transcript_13509:1342-2268(+)
MRSRRDTEPVAAVPSSTHPTSHVCVRLCVLPSRPGSVRRRRGHCVRRGLRRRRDDGGVGTHGKGKHRGLRVVSLGMITLRVVTLGMITLRVAMIKITAHPAAHTAHATESVRKPGSRGHLRELLLQQTKLIRVHGVSVAKSRKIPGEKARRARRPHRAKVVRLLVPRLATHRAVEASVSFPDPETRTSSVKPCTRGFRRRLVRKLHVPHLLRSPYELAFFFILTKLVVPSHGFADDGRRVRHAFRGALDAEHPCGVCDFPRKVPVVFVPPRSHITTARGLRPALNSGVCFHGKLANARAARADHEPGR